MTPYNTFEIYHSLKLHFTSNYDAIKYQFKTRIKEQSFWRRNDRLFFAKLGKRFGDNKEALIFYFVTQFINDKNWIGDMIDGDEYFDQWVKENESLSYNFDNDISLLHEKYHSFNMLFQTEEGKAYPNIINEYLSNTVSLNTVTILDILTNFIQRVDKDTTDTILWPDIKNKVLNYKPFLKIDKEKMTKVITKYFTF